MIRIIDRTLSCLDHVQMTGEQVAELAQLLYRAGADSLELSSKWAAVPLPAGKYVLRIDHPGQTSQWPGYNRFLCPKFQDADRHVYPEIQVNDVRETHLLAQYADAPLIRVCGLSDTLNRDFKAVFHTLREALRGRVELCPDNGRYGCGTALAVEWIGCGGQEVVTSWGGIGGLVPFAEVSMALRVLKRRKPGAEFAVFPRLRQLMEEITGETGGETAPVVGPSIFQVESGIHVSAICKQPKCYEPFSPEEVGLERKIMVGAFSGKASVRWKLEELGIALPEVQLPAMVKDVKSAAIARGHPLDDDTIRAIAARQGGSIP